MFFSPNGNPPKSNNGTTNDFIEVYKRVPVANPNLTYVSNINDYYSTKQREYVKDIVPLTYPTVIPNLYTINTEGAVFNLETHSYCTPYDHGEGYICVSLRNTEGYPKGFLVHRLVAYQFRNPPINTVDGLKVYNVNHIDGNRKNNNAGNLEWVPIHVNNQHSRYILNDGANVFRDTGRPIVDANFVHRVCMMFVEGKSNTQIMNELGMQINNANHTLLRDIRGGYTWKDITSQYDFDRSSKKHAYTAEEKDKIAELMKSGKSVKEIFAIMQGREYVASTDRLDSSYRTIQSIQVKLRKEGYNV